MAKTYVGTVPPKKKRELKNENLNFGSFRKEIRKDH